MKMIGAVLAAAMMQLARWRRGGVAGRSSRAAEAEVDCCALAKDRKYGAFDEMMIVEEDVLPLHKEHRIMDILLVVSAAHKT